MTDAPTASAPVTPPAAPPRGRRVRWRLQTVRDTSVAMADILRQWKAGTLDSQDMSRVVNALSVLSRNISESDVEARVAEIEKAMEARMPFRRGAA